MKESTIQLKIIKALQERGIYCWRNANLVRYDTKTRQYLSNPQHKSGVGDIIAILPGGIHCEIEVKTPTGKQSPAQAIHQRRVQECGGRYILARSVADVVDNLS